MSGLTVGDLIKALQKFPQDWHVCIGSADCDGRAIKGITECSESDGFGGLQYAFVQIEPMRDVTLDDLIGGKLECYGDKVWYNTKDSFREVFKDLSHVEYNLTDSGEVNILECKNMKGKDISLWDINEYDRYWRIVRDGDVNE